MKKAVFIAITALALVSCSKEFAPESQVFTLEASMPGTLTKVTVGLESQGVFPLTWAEGDVITVNGINSLPLSSSKAGGKTAIFAFDKSISAPYNVIYGASSSARMAPPQLQLYSPSGINEEYLRMEANSEETSFTLAHRTAIVAVSLVGSLSLVGMELSSADGSALSDGGSATAVMSFPDGGINISEAKTFYFATIPGEHPKGLDIKLVASDGSVMHYGALKAVELEAGKVYELPQTAFSANAEPVELIGDYAALKAFAARVADGELYLNARLVSDIVADDSWQPIEGFKGVLDGGGHTLSGLHKAIFNELTGCVKNLVVNAEISISGADDIVGDNSVFWAGIIANRLYTYSSVSNCITEGSISYSQWGKELRVGAVAGYAPRGTILSCVNRASVTATGDGSAIVQAGGLIGRNYASSDEIIIRNCRNEGAVLVKGALKGVYAGGIIGMMDSRHTSVLSGDVNCGSVSIDPSASISGEVRLGGIAGYALAGMENCLNYGTLHSAAPMTQPQSVGGIAGQIITSSVSGCENSGTIVLDAPQAGVIRVGGILAYAGGDSVVNSINLSSCSFTGSMEVNVASHSSIYVKAITGLYSDITYTETDCISSGSVSVK